MESKVVRKVGLMEVLILPRTWNGHRNRLQEGWMGVHSVVH
jgi:hypothetical protein